MKKISIYITPKSIYKVDFQVKYDVLFYKLTNQRCVIHNGGMKDTLIKVVLNADFLENWIKDMELIVHDVLEAKNPYQAIEISSTDGAAEKLLQERKDSFLKNTSSIEDLKSVFQPQKAGNKGDVFLFEDEFDLGYDVDVATEEEDVVEKTQQSTHEMLVNFSPEMQSYITELKQVTENLHSVKSLEQFYETCLMVSIDEGYGYSSFIQVVSDHLDKYYSSYVKSERIYWTEITPDKGVSAWKKEKDVIRRLSEDMEKRNEFTIKAYEMREWMEVFSDPNFYIALRDMGQAAKNVLLVFRIPYIEEERLEEIRESLSNVISLRTVSVPPVSMEYMKEYMKTKFQESGFVLEDCCDELLEEWISQEKNESHFYGYKTLDKMISELIYQKALLAKSADKASKFTKDILLADIKNMLNAPIETKDAYELLDDMIGLDDVKTKIREIVSQVKMQKSMKEQGVDLGEPTLHMMFLGNPGTGKTTVARYLGKIFRQEGLLPKGLFIEKTGSDFVDNKVGTLAQKVRGYCKDSYGSVLFIDEAYAMSVGHSSGNITDETVPVLVTEMENNRDKMCVIFAGYDKEIKEFLKSNSGLESRIPHTLEFPNYTRDELVEIFFHNIKGTFEYEEGFREQVEDYMHALSEDVLTAKEFSNARFVRNLYERVWAKMAYRISYGEDKATILRKADFKAAIEETDFQEMMNEKKAEKRIGFVTE